MGLVSNKSIDFLNDGRWLNLIKAGIVTAMTLLLSEDAARAAVKIQLDGILLLLSPAHEACIGMGGTPDADYGNARQRGQVHIA